VVGCAIIQRFHWSSFSKKTLDRSGVLVDYFSMNMNLDGDAEEGHDFFHNALGV